VNARILPPEEWSRLDRKPVMLFPYVQPENIDVVVVEDEGEISACMTVLRATHFEGLWITPERRKNAGVMRALLRQATALARLRGDQWVFGGAEKDEMRGYLERGGGVKVPMDLCALWVGGEACRL
jgi:hypothetical protein